MILTIKNQQQLQSNTDELILSVQRWNVLYPIDRWWRKKFNIPFNSSNHREVGLIDIRFQFEEEVLYNKINSDIDQKKDYKPGTGDWLMSQERYQENLSDDEVDELFENFNEEDAI